MLSTLSNHGRDTASPRSRARAAPWITAAAHTPRKNRGAMDGQAQLSTSPGSALKGFLRKRRSKRRSKKEGAKRKSAKPPQATARLSFAALQDRRALPLSYVKNNVVTQDGPPCSGLSADMIGLRPITSHALQRHIPSCCSAGLAYPLGQAASRFLSGAVGLPVPLLQSPTLARRRRL